MPDKKRPNFIKYQFRAEINRAIDGQVKDELTVYLAKRFVQLDRRDQVVVERNVTVLVASVPRLSPMAALELVYKVSPFMGAR